MNTILNNYKGVHTIKNITNLQNHSIHIFLYQNQKLYLRLCS